MVGIWDVQTSHLTPHTLLGMVMGSSASERRMVRIGSTRSTVPVMTWPPPDVSISTRSPTTNGWLRNCAGHGVDV
jgi:hypothetical protein